MATRDRPTGPADGDADDDVVGIAHLTVVPENAREGACPACDRELDED